MACSERLTLSGNKAGNYIFAVVRHFFHILLILFSTQNLCAQHSVMRHFDTKNGLPSNEVYQLLNDSKGYIWICTDAGLVKYNGNTFKQFNSSNGLPDNTVFQAKEDRFGRIWYITYAGKIGYISNDSVYVVNLSAKMEGFVTSGLITSIAFDDENNLYVGRRNLEVISFLKVSPPYKAENIKEIWRDDGSVVSIHLIGANDYVFSDSRRQTGKLTLPIKLYKEDKLVLSELGMSQQQTIFTRVYRNSGQLYLIFGTELFNFDLHNNEVNKCSSKNGFITVVAIDPGKVFVGETHSGLIQLSDKLKTLGAEPELNGKTVTYVVKDYQGGTFVSTLESGVYYLPKQSVSYMPIPMGNEEAVLKTFAIAAKKIWILSSGLKVYELDLSHPASPILRTVFDNKGNELKELGTAFTNGSNTIIMLTAQGSYELDVTTGKLRKDNTGACKAHMTTGVSYGRSVLYFSYSGVTQIVENKNETETKFYKSEDRITCLARDPSSNTIVAGGLRGLYDFKFRNITAADTILSCRTEDVKYNKKGMAFVATRMYGVIVIKNGVNDTIQVKNGLLSNICKSVTIDSEYVWVCTNDGISRINYEGKNKYRIHNYPLSGFLQPASINRVYLLADKITFISGNTVYWLDKNTSASPAKLNLTGVVVNDTIYAGNIPFKLSPGELDIKINFEAMLFNGGGELSYRYKLSDQDAWIYTKENSIVLQKLSAGEYRIQIEVLNVRGDWLKFQPILFSIDTPFFQKLWFLISCIVVIAGLVFLTVKWRYKRILEQQRIKSELKINMLELETKVVKAQMNPHFIFNSLNSIQQFILANDNENAHVYLTKFSKLVRKLLESTTTEDISLEDEIDLLNRYIEIESLRFEDSFSYKLHVDPALKASSLRIPHMIIQPFVENAIWHGLLHKKGERLLEISFLYLNEQCITCLIEDNGVGRGIKNTVVAGKTSLAMDFIEKRLKMINELKHSSCGFKITDKTENEHKENGTIVDIKIPIMNR
jgi:WD40 repeat protein